MLFKKVLIANRGEIAVRAVRACREMGILTVALYEAADQGSLHVRLADECVLLPSTANFMDQAAILQIARERGADAIYPGYGFLAEQASFIEACDAAGIIFIGPPAEVVATVRQKIDVLERARAAGFATVAHSPRSFGENELDELVEAAGRLGYPLIIKSCSGGRGAASRLVRTPEKLLKTVRRAQAEAQSVYGDRRVYLEQALLPAHQVGVQVMGDRYGRLIHLGEREGSLQQSNRKLIEESPAPCLAPEQRQRLWQAALDLARLFNYQNLGTVEFLVDSDGRFYFTELKARIQVEHPITEMVARIDLVRQQMRLAAGEPLAWTQDEIQLHGCAMLCRIHAEDPWHHFMPTPGRLRRVRPPLGLEVRVDTYLYSDSEIPGAYDSLIAKLTVWGEDRDMCVGRMRGALQDFKLVGTPNNLPHLQRILAAPEFKAGVYTTEFQIPPFNGDATPEPVWRDLAVAAAILYTRRQQTFNPSFPERLLHGWHRDSRRVDR